MNNIFSNKIQIQVKRVKQKGDENYSRSFTLESKEDVDTISSRIYYLLKRIGESEGNIQIKHIKNG